MSSFGGVILAGGNSTRMGKTKAFLDVDGEYFISRIYRTLSGVFDEVLIIEAELTGRYEFLTQSLCTDIYKNSGPLAGIHSAFVNSVLDILFVASCDVPLLSPAMVSDVMIASIGYDAAIPRTVDGIHPLCGAYNRRTLPKIEEYLNLGYRSMNGFLKQIDVHYLDVSENESRDLSNINTPKEYQSMLGGR